MDIMTNDTEKSKLNKQIDENLRRVYSESLEEPVPERFTRLLEQLRDRERETEEEDRDDPPSETGPNGADTGGRDDDANE